MSPRSALLAIFAFSTLAPTPARGAAGSTALDFLRLDIGPREAGMGGAGVALGGDSYSAAYNPALLTASRRPELGFSQVLWLGGIQYQDIAYVHPSAIGNFGVQLERLDYGSVDGYDATGARIGSVAPSDFSAGLQYARPALVRGLSLGAGVKVVRESLGPVAAQAVLADLGATYAPHRHDWLGDSMVGLSLRNLGPSIRFDELSQPPPTELVVGVATRLQQEALTLALDGHFPKYQSPHGNIGGELWVTDGLAMRLGMEFVQDQGTGLRAGFGVKYKTYQLDYAFSPVGDLGQTHHIGFRILFGGPADAAYQEGMRLMRREDFGEAILKFNEVLRIDPKYTKAETRLRQCYQLLQKTEVPPK